MATQPNNRNPNGAAQNRAADPTMFGAGSVLGRVVQRQFDVDAVMNAAMTASSNSQGPNLSNVMGDQPPADMP